MGGHWWGGGLRPSTPPLHILRGQSPLKLPNFFLDFGIPKLRTFFEDFDPMWPLQRSYCLENVRILSLSILGFHQNLSKILIFISQSPPFYENPISSVRPSETQKGRFLCVHPHSGGVVGFSIIGFWGTELLRLGEPLGGSWTGPGPWRRLRLTVVAVVVAFIWGGHAGKFNN